MRSKPDRGWIRKEKEKMKDKMISRPRGHGRQASVRLVEQGLSKFAAVEHH
jgi:hypothetical protein